MVTQESKAVPVPAQDCGPVIYIVDDESLIGEVVQAILKLEGFRPLFFVDSQQAYEAFAEADPKPDLLLADFIMTPMNGMELIERCKQLAPDLKTLLYSGNVGEEIVQFYSARPDGFLSKPFLPKQLIALVNRILGQGLVKVS
jgi:two-component system response regulator CssR